ncbi:RICIN domain-containing protein [Demequina aurantiaca]|uniref:RICIN domain-containing protein n=1 Tax=Demequina aurantiaca TaxID=676200 RepID=UPI0007847450|nr:RICIN domain-containing protein [Demequina aurantiaca]
MTAMSRALANARMKRIRHDEGFAMLSVMMLMMVMTVLAIIVLAVVTSQVNPTLHAEKNSRTLSAAQAGIDAAASQLRNATSPDGTGAPAGDIHKLPCKVNGTVDGTGGETSYEAKVQYFLTDPVDEDVTWRNSNALTCYTGTGINGGVRSVPKYAMITSEGFDATSTSQVGRADRIVESAYTFQLTTKRISGGMILDTDSAFCLVATAAAAGSNIRYRPATSTYCQDQSELNSWTWADDYMLHLSATSLDGKIPLCITGRASSGGGGNPVTLQPCTTTAQDPLGQRWAWTGDYTWKGQNAANTSQINSFIVNEDSNVDNGDRLSVSTSSGFRSLTPLPAVGKGNASYDTKQVVNFNLYGRCLDVTRANINANFMIAYPCKQDPAGNGGFLWNHKWYYDEPPLGTESVTTKITVIPSAGNTYCLNTTATYRTQARPDPPGGNASALFPRFVNGSGNKDCSSGNTEWIRTGFSNDEDLAYTFRDNNGKCLSADGPKTAYEPQWTSIVVVTCDGSDNQKWNVPENPVGASLGDFAEVPGTDAG